MLLMDAQTITTTEGRRQVRKQKLDKAHPRLGDRIHSQNKGIVNAGAGFSFESFTANQSWPESPMMHTMTVKHHRELFIFISELQGCAVDLNHAGCVSQSSEIRHRPDRFLGSLSSTLGGRPSTSQRDRNIDNADNSSQDAKQKTERAITSH